MKYIILLLIVTIFSSVFVNVANGLKCYTCSSAESALDVNCISDPEKATGSAITNCNKQYCLITRVEYVDPKDKVQSIWRGCADEKHEDGVVEEGGQRTYYFSCQKDLCNDGSGKEENDDNKNYLGDKSTLYVPGTSPATIATLSILTLLLSFISFVIFL